MSFARQLAEEGGLKKNGNRANGQKWSTILDNNGYYYFMAKVGMNFVYTKKALSAEQLVGLWMEDTANKSNVRYRDFTNTGAAMYYDEEGETYCYVQLFAKPAYKSRNPADYVTYRAVLVRDATVFSGPDSSKYREMGRLKAGDEVVALYYIEGWVRITFGDTYAFINTNHIKKLT